MKTYQKISSLIMAIETCDRTSNLVWSAKHRMSLQDIANNLPSGSGIDCGTKIDPNSTPDEIVLNLSYHHMNDGGYYDGWSEIVITVTPSLTWGFELDFTWEESAHPDLESDLEDYLGEVYQIALNEEIA